MAKKKEVYHVKPLTEGKKNIIASLIEEYDIETADDIQEALKDLLGGTIKSMMEAEMDEHLGYESYERSDNVKKYSQLYSQPAIIKKVGNKVGNKKPLNKRREKIIAEMRDNPNITVAQLHTIIGVSETAIENNINFLRDNGYIERIGSKRAGYWHVIDED